MQETQVQSLGREDPLEKGKAPHSSILAWRIPWMEEPGSLPLDLVLEDHPTFVLLLRYLLPQGMP